MQNRWQGLLTRHSRALAIAFAVYWCAMFLATHLPMPRVDSAPQNTDKVVHFVMYAGFAFLFSAWLTTLRGWNPRAMFFAMSLAVTYAALDEILQIPIESRSADLLDFAMDFIGAAIGLGIFSIVHRKCPVLWESPSSME